MSDDPYKYFRIEAREILDRLSPGVLRLEREGDDADGEDVEQLLRLVHTLKGAAGVVDLDTIAVLAHDAEDILAHYRDEPGQISPDDVSQLLELIDELEAEIDQLQEATPTREIPIQTQFGGDVQRTGSRGTDDGRLDSLRVGMEQMDELLAGLMETSVEVVGLDAVVEDLQRTQQLVGRLKGVMASAEREDGYGLTPHQLRERNQQLVDRIHSLVDETRRALTDRTKRISRELSAVRKDAADMRLVPVNALRSPLERAVRDAANVRGKQVDFALIAGQTRLDASVLAGIREALLHLVRNAVAHGIEAPEWRRAAGKPVRGRVEVRVERDGDQICLICSDDGQGIDEQAVGRAAVERGLITAEQAQELSADEAIELLLEGAALTTSADVDSVSGRGLGLDIVRRAAARLNGRLAIETRAGQGTRVNLTVPISVAATSVLHLRHGAVTAAIPTDAVVEVVSVSASDVVTSANGDAIALSDQLLRFAPLSPLLGGAEDAAARSKWTAVVVDSIAGRAVVGGERVLGIEEVVVRPLPEIARVEEIVAGGYLDSAGRPCLVVEPTTLVEATQRTRAPVVTEAAPKPASTVLVIDDSLTTRMLEQSILETAGYEVELASSAEEGLELAADNDYAIFLVDVEMPGIDGFEFVEMTRRDARLRKVPAILVTSRSAAADRQRGLEVGAAAYIVKGEFEQRQLLGEIERLINQADAPSSPVVVPPEEK